MIAAWGGGGGVRLPVGSLAGEYHQMTWHCFAPDSIMTIASQSPSGEPSGVHSLSHSNHIHTLGRGPAGSVASDAICDAPESH